MFRKTLIALLILSSTVALAGIPARQTVLGEGVAVSEDGREGQFSIRAVKVLLPDGPRIEGSFRFATGNREAQTATVIEAQVERLMVDGRQAGFAGRGVMVVRRGEEVRRVAGIVEGRCADLHNPRSEDDRKDTLAFVFHPRTGDDVRFAGAVRRGDIRITSVR